MARTVRTPAGKITFFSSEILHDVDSRIERAMRETVYLLENRIKELQTGRRSGYWYRIGKTPTKQNIAMGIKAGPWHRARKMKAGRWYQASAPGEPPAIKSSRLFKSITSRVEPMLTAGGGLGWKGSVGTNVQDYPPALEFGVKKGAGAKLALRVRRVTMHRKALGGGEDQAIIAKVRRVTFMGGWRLAPRPLWRRAVNELKGAIIDLWKAAGKQQGGAS
jgi:hypothetical protein